MAIWWHRHRTGFGQIYFDTVDSWEKYSQNRASQTDLRPLLRIYYIQKEWTLVFSNSQRHFQFLGFPTSPNMGHAPHNQALLPKPTKWPLRPRGTLEPHDYTLWPNMLDPSTPYRPYIYRLKSDRLLMSPQYSFTIARDWEIIAEAWKVPGIPPLPTKPHGLEKQYSVQLIEDFIWENPELSLNLLVNYAYNNRGFAEYIMHICFDHLARTYKLELPSFGVDDRRVGAIYRFPLDPDVGSVVDDMIRQRCTSLWCSGVSVPAADAESAAVMKQWKVDRLQVEERVVHVEIPLIHVSRPNPWHIRPHEGYPGESSCDDEEHSLSYIASRMFGANDMCETHVAILHDLLGPGPWPSAQTYVVLGFRWVYEYGERIKVYDNEEDDPTFSTPKPAASSGVDDNDRMDIFGVIMGNPFDTEFDDTYDGHDEDDDYWREPSPLDPGQENAVKALISAAENGDDSAWQRIELALRGAHGKKRGKSHNGKPAQKADRSRNELEAVEKSKAEELRWEAETHVREVEQRECEASQSRQSAPTVSSVPPPPPPPPPPMPAPHHPPAASGSAQHAPAASTTGPALLPPQPPAPAPGLPDVNTPCPVAPVRHPPPALDSSYRHSAARPLSLVLSPCLENPQEHLRAILSVSTETYSVEDTTTSTTLSVPTTMLLVMDSTKMTALPISMKTIPVTRSSWAAITAKLRSRLTPLVAGPSSSAMKPGNNVSWPPPECLRMAHWPALDIEGIDHTEEPMDWVRRYSEHGVLAARRLRPNQRKGAQYHMYLLFKDMAKRDSCLQILAGSLVNNQVESFQYENDLVNCLGVTEVRYMQEAYVNAHSMAEVKELLAIGPIPYLIPLDAIDEMLDYKQFPALIDPCPGDSIVHARETQLL
ncbi:hypothetical protein BS47DRAFT_1364752 [Hydnum rufescens UP504]|uniref:Uncharacterized protein n=1 Tax=Hydnum rufescens UP504 TaxID=1448309 RepID=A0A9P6DQK8_9AGAM|nr:hypothetical protein BS47DRAFT_1364752 [Hydnum rufescens UP504]